MTPYTDYNLLFSDYISVCNQALASSAEKFPFKQILSSVHDRSKGEIVDVEIIDGQFSSYFRLRIDTGGVRAVPVCQKKYEGQCCGGCRNRVWQVQSSYLQYVIHHSDEYIQNPALLDWEWLYEMA
jgi:hypothetical protein